MNKLATTQQNQSLAVFEDGDFEDTKAAAQGLSSGLAFVRIEGKSYVLAEGGDRITLGPKFSGIILGVGPLSKRYFAGTNYTEGKAPECASADGVNPDPAIATPQCTTCAKCLQNVWGSKISGLSGKQMKACQEYRRVVVAVMGDQYEGGYKLYRLDIPTMSLNPFKMYTQNLREFNKCPPFGVATLFSFDPAAKYPVLNFTPAQVFTPEQVAEVRVLKKDALVQEMLTIQMSDMNEKEEADDTPAQAETVAVPTKKRNVSKPKTQTARQVSVPKVAVPTVPVQAEVAEEDDDEIPEGLENFQVDLPSITQKMKQATNQKLGD
jgi:hypothetical protein